MLIDERFAASLPISAARRQWRQVIRTCAAGPVLLTRRGVPLLVVLSLQEYEALRSQVVRAGHG